LNPPGKNRNMVTLMVEMASEQASYLSAPARENDSPGGAHGATSKGAGSSSL
jgi:hypothetical protein